jgi:acyl-coenzyme A thioesterase PaaI-like protein
MVLTQKPIALSERQISRMADLNNAFKMWFFLLINLPAAWFMGVRVKKITAERGEVTLPYAWKSQNPFNSIYFAAQAAAAEFSTGALAMLALEGRGQISMLVSNIEMEFTKKANSTTTFTCEQGAEVFEIVERAIQTKQPQTLTMVSKGVQKTGELVSITKITWSFKAK